LSSNRATLRDSAQTTTPTLGVAPLREAPMRLLLATSALGLGLIGVIAANRKPHQVNNFEPTLNQVRVATQRFRDVNVALAEGYVRDPMNLCDEAQMMGKPKELGVMGIHFFRPDLLGITAPPNPRVNGDGTHTDFTKPAILIYEPQADETLQLVAVENLVFIKAWEAAGNAAPPSFQGVPYDKMVDDAATEVDEAHMFEPHYDRHVWLYRDNPNATCKYHRGGAHKH
jgi:hypothetical protein